MDNFDLKKYLAENRLLQEDNLEELGSSAENLELKSLAKKIYSLFKGEGMGVKIATPQQDPYRNYTSSKDWFESRPNTYLPVEIYTDEFNTGQNFLHIVLPEETVLAKVTGGIKELDIDYESWARHAEKLNRNRPKMDAYGRDLASKINSITPDNMESKWTWDKKSDVYRLWVWSKSTGREGGVAATEE